MSVKLMTRVWEDQTIKDRTELLLMLSLADWCDEDGCCYPGIKKLAAKTRIGERGTYKILEALEAKNYIHRDTKTSKYKTNVYQLYPEPRCRVEPTTHPEPPFRMQKKGKNSHNDLPEGLLELECGCVHPEPPFRVTLNHGSGNTSEEPSSINHQSNNIEASPKKLRASEHQRFIEGWSALFLVQFGYAYRVNGGIDGKAVKELLTQGTADELIAKAKAAWEHGSDPRCWFCGKLTTIKFFSSKFNEINCELSKVNGKSKSREHIPFAERF